MSLQDKIIVITGSTRGYGFAVAQEALEAGATVIISGRSQASVDAALEKLAAYALRVMGIPCDVSVEAQVHALADQVVERFGRMDIWVNNAGLSSAAGRIYEFPPEAFERIFRINCLGAVHGTQAALKHMLPRGKGVIAFTYGNGSFLRPASPTGPYGASKAWITSFTRTLAKDLKGRGIRVFGFSPGMMWTDMLTAPTVIGEAGKEMLKNYGFVLRFLGQPPEKPARKFVQMLGGLNKDFVEYRVFKPWTPFLGLLKVGWENLTHTGTTPEFELDFEPAYRFERKQER